ELGLEQFHEDVVRRAVAGGGVAVLAGVFLYLRDPLGHRARGKGRMHAQEEAGRAEAGDRRELGGGGGTRFFNQLRRRAQRRDRRNEKRVAVGLGRSDRLGADQRAGAGLVVDHDRLLERGGQRVADRAAEHVDQRARGIRHDQLDRLRRVRRLRGGG